MTDGKQKILEQIFENYAAWTAGEIFSCRKGCSLCCSQNVMITAVEGRHIYDYILTHHMEKWLGARLSIKGQRQRIRLTTNGFARVCLARDESIADDELTAGAGTCPFLADNCCVIYEVRPFACRSFASTRDCHESGSACLSERMIVLNTVSMQMIEHIGQYGYWGNMLDVLLALSLERENQEVKKYIEDEALIDAAMARLLQAEPLPGFLLKPGEEHEVREFLQAIFPGNIGTAAVKDILSNTAG